MENTLNLKGSSINIFICKVNVMETTMPTENPKNNADKITVNDSYIKILLTCEFVNPTALFK